MSLVNSTNEEEQNEKTGKENCSVFDGYGSVHGIYDNSRGYFAALRGKLEYSCSDQRSRTHTWTALETSSDLFIRTSANTVNVGAEDTYYKVAISAGGGACSQVLCNLGYLVQRDVNDSVVEGERYGTYAWRVDSTLNTDVVDGLTYIYSR